MQSHSVVRSLKVTVESWPNGFTSDKIC